MTKSFQLLLSNGGVWQYIEVPAGFETDLASIPLIFQPFIGAATEFSEEATAHDFLCSNGYPQFFANAQMRIIMEIMQRPKIKRIAIFWALQLFGYKSLILNFGRRVCQIMNSTINSISKGRPTS